MGSTTSATGDPRPLFARRLRISAIASIVAGVICLLFPLLAGVLAILVVGIVILAAGGVSFATARRIPAGVKGKKRYVLESVVILAIGVLILVFPMIGSALVTWVLAIPALVVGASRILASFELRPRAGWTSVLAAGVLMALVGLMLLVGWPFSGAVIAGIVLGFAFLADGMLRLRVARTFLADR